MGRGDGEADRVEDVAVPERGTQYAIFLLLPACGILILQSFMSTRGMGK